MKIDRGGHELRFSRNRSGAALCAISLPLLFAGGAAAIDGGLSAAWAGPAFEPALGRLLLAAALLSAGFLGLLFGLTLSRRTYVVSTPLGLDILPLWRPETRMILVGWHELSGVSKRGRALVLKRRDGSSLRIGGMRARQVQLLQYIVEERLRQIVGFPEAEQPAPSQDSCP